MPPAISRTMSATEWGLLVTLSMLWGGSFFFNAIALAGPAAAAPSSPPGS